MKPFSIFILHPDDEKPQIRVAGEENKSQFQHEVPPIGDDCLSLSFIFRTVTHKEVFSKKDSKLVLFGNRLQSLFNENKFHTNETKANHLHHADANKQWEKVKPNFIENFVC